MLRTRALIASILAPLALSAALFGSWWLFIVLGVGFALCGYEYFTMLATGGLRTERALGVALIVALLLDAFLGLKAARVIWLVLVVVPPALELRRRTHENFLTHWALTALGVLYIGGLGANVFPLRALPNGAACLIITLLATWATDTTAYFVGSHIGRHPFFPEISPKKTWEGAIGGLVGATLIFGTLASILGINPALALIGGMGIGLAGTLGDLTESLLKRQAGVKDSGSILSGHGGMFDRLDSTLFTVTFAYYFFVIVAH